MPASALAAAVALVVLVVVVQKEVETEGAERRGGSGGGSGSGNGNRPPSSSSLLLLAAETTVMVAAAVAVKPIYSRQQPRISPSKSTTNLNPHLTSNASRKTMSACSDFFLLWAVEAFGLRGCKVTRCSQQSGYVPG